ncbi:MAG: hypothetical protein AABX29_07615 [Nanoarchaeota archaeon]
MSLLEQPFRKALMEGVTGKKALVFDSGPIISLVMDNLAWTLRALNKKFNGDFYITNEVKREVIDKPLTSKRFKFEAMYIKEFLDEHVLKLADEDLTVETNRLLRLSNSIYKTRTEDLKLFQKAEIESLALVKHLNAEALVVDERTLRMLIEEPENLKELLNKKLGRKVTIDSSNLKQFQKLIGDVNVIRSSELLVVAFELGLLDKYADGNKRELLDGILWGVKLRGCSISSEEIYKIIKFEGF